MAGVRVDRTLKTAGLVVLAGAAAGFFAAVLIKNQMTRHQMGLFSPHAFQRLAALGHMARSNASVDRINLLKDFIVWEPRPLLRSRARTILGRMEREIAQPPVDAASGVA
jgi:hypothetical protein